MLKNSLSEVSQKVLTVKNLSDTTWSTRASALKALLTAIGISRLQDIFLSPNWKTGFMTILWHDILKRFDACSKSLQAADQDLNTSCTLYESLIEFVESFYCKFEDVEQRSKVLTKRSEYREESSPVRRPSRGHVEPGSDQPGHRAA